MQCVRVCVCVCLCTCMCSPTYAILCVQCVCSGILVGAGQQKIAAVGNLVSYYCIGLPVGGALMLATHLRLLGDPQPTLYSILYSTSI